MMFWVVVFVLSAVLLAVSGNTKCSFPAPATGFTNEQYKGKWYEIGKIQTAGGAFFEKDCVCTQLNIAITNESTGDGIADNDCRYKTTTGRWTNVTGSLHDEDLIHAPGRWLETISTNAVNYTVIAISADYAVEYDCGTSNGITNYCIHVMSRKPTLDQDTFDKLIQMSEEMGLNPNQLPVQMTTQEGCE